MNISEKISVNTQVQEISLDNKKELGIFYTPVELTNILSKWAIRSPQDRVLEPSFGGCNFLDSSRDILKSLGNLNIINQLAGCDTDPQAFTYLKNTLDVSEPPTQFKQIDFLQAELNDFQDSFDVVIGNPPYISRHNMPNEQIELGQQRCVEQGYKLSKRASLWGYFVLHSLSFLKEGGRIAFILPSSFLNAQYAMQIQEYLRNGFERALVLQIGQRVFLNEGTSEVAVVVLCEGWQANHHHEKQNPMELAFVPTLVEAEIFIKKWSDHQVTGTLYDGRSNFALLPKTSLVAYLKIVQRKKCHHFEDFATVLIGMVTGANKFFVINLSKAEEEQLPSEVLRFVVAKYSYFSGLTLTNEHLEQAKTDDLNCLLFDTRELKSNLSSVQQYLDSFSTDKRNSNKTFKKREHWDQPDDGRIPDAFFTYMSHDGPAMRLNQAQVNSTNTVHRVFFNDTVDETTQKLLSISLLTTFSQLSAEIESRSYGSGVLKHEPSEIKRFKIYVPNGLKPVDIEEKFIAIDALLRKNNKEEARSVADNFILGDFPQHADILEKLNSALNITRSRRIPNYNHN